MTQNFYDKVARKFGQYHTGANYTTEYLDGEPEKVFNEKLLKVSGKDKMVLDVGCADGRFTLSVAPNFQKITAIDISKDMLEVARKFQREKRVANVGFEEQDADKTSFQDGAFDIVYSRRGPTPFPEFRRLLKTGGYFIGIEIGEKDCKEIKVIFGRGQNYGGLDDSQLEKDKQELKNNGFEIIFARGYFYNEYYASYEELDLFLQGVPLFEDFDSEKDREHLEEYVKRFKTEKGIKLSRHRVVTVAKISA